MLYDPEAVNQCREKTASHAKTAGITLRLHVCHKCKTPKLGASKVKGTGTSRHNPALWKCQEC